MVPFRTYTCTAILSLLAVSGLACGSQDDRVVDTGAAISETTGAEFDRSVEDPDKAGQPILSTLPPPVDEAIVVEDEVVKLEASTSQDAEKVVCLSLTNVGTRRSSSICGDPRFGDDVVLAATSESPDSPKSDWVHFGYTRASAETITVISADGNKDTIEIHHHPSFPDFGFFYFNDLGPLDSFVAVDEAGVAVAEASTRTLSYSHTDPSDWEETPRDGRGE